MGDLARVKVLWTPPAGKLQFSGPTESEANCPYLFLSPSNSVCDQPQVYWEVYVKGEYVQEVEQ